VSVVQQTDDRATVRASGIASKALNGVQDRLGAIQLAASQRAQCQQSSAECGHSRIDTPGQQFAVFDAAREAFVLRRGQCSANLVSS
jgi:hypothetical protein